MSDLPLVSVVVISYNHGKYIRENLDSIKAQTYPNIELIVADDASADNSVEIFNEWLVEHNYTAQKNYHIQNTGLATVLNECITVSRGKYIKLSSADDFFHPEFIEKCVKELEVLGDRYGMVHTDYTVVNESSEELLRAKSPDIELWRNPEKYGESLIIKNTIAAVGVLLRVKTLRDTGPYDSQYITEDYCRWLLINEKYYIGYIPQNLVYYRQHDTNISKIKEVQMMQEDARLKMRFDKKGLAAEYLKSFFAARLSANESIPDQLWNSYKKYRWRDKILILIKDYHLPFLMYRILNKLTSR